MATIILNTSTKAIIVYKLQMPIYKKLTINLVNFFKLIIGGWNYANKAIFYFEVVNEKVW
jgi:hypothetical protein